MFGTIIRGWALATQGQREEGIAQIRQGLAAYRAMGAEAGRTYFLGLLAEVYEKMGQLEEGLAVLAEAQAAVRKTEDRWYEAELYRIKGELTLKQSRVQSLGSKLQKSSESRQGKTSQDESRVPASRGKSRLDQASLESEAEACFCQAIEVARRQRAKSWELRAVTSLSRLWQQQGKKKEARKLLGEIYSWFTEGLDTTDLKEAKALLAEMS